MMNLNQDPNPEPNEVEIIHEDSPQGVITANQADDEGELIIADDHRRNGLPLPLAMHHPHTLQPMHTYQQNFIPQPSYNQLQLQNHFAPHMHHHNHNHFPSHLPPPNSVNHQQHAMNMQMHGRQNGLHLNHNLNMHPSMYNHHPSIGQADHSRQLHRYVSNQATSELPSTEEFAGEFDFHINVTRALEETKRPAWEFSELLNKLYVMESRSVPIQFKVSKVDMGMYIRAVAVYCDPDSSNKPVLRCPNHARCDEPLNAGYEHIKHVVRCNHSSAVYQEDPVSCRLSVSVPLGFPQPGSDFVTILFSMMCRSSCTNGINRRSVAIVYTLEIDGKVYGRRVLPIRVCASPNRDRRLDEERAGRPVNGDGNTVTVKSENIPMLDSVAADHANDPLGPLEQLHFVPVINCDDYITLARMARDLVLRDYPEGPLRDMELQRYQSILNSTGENHA